MEVIKKGTFVFAQTYGLGKVTDSFNSSLMNLYLVYFDNGKHVWVDGLKLEKLTCKEYFIKKAQT